MYILFLINSGDYLASPVFFCFYFKIIEKILFKMIFFDLKTIFIEINKYLKRFQLI